MGFENGMSDQPGQCTSLLSRLICVKCGREPVVDHPERIVKGPYYTITVKCHGETETRTIEAAEMVYTQRFFKPEGEDE
jgi:hypothetical protein